jgi:hypothetical protein
LNKNPQVGNRINKKLLKKKHIFLKLLQKKLRGTLLSKEKALHFFPEEKEKKGFFKVSNQYQPMWK